MDVRTLIAGIASIVAIIASATLYAMGDTVGAQQIGAIAAAGMTYMLGLYSQPYDGDDEGDA